MQTFYYFIRTLVGVWILSLTACKESKTNVDNENESLVVDAPAKRFSDPTKGAHRVDPEMTKILGDTLGIVMYELIMKPGDSIAWHDHPYHTVYVLDEGTLAIYFEDKGKQIFDLPKGFAIIQPQLGDATVNIGETTVRLLTHDIYALDPKEWRRITHLEE